jgi:hypothetical protein
MAKRTVALKMVDGKVVATVDGVEMPAAPTTPVEQVPSQEREPQKTASVTLTGADGSSLYLLAERKPDGAVTTVNTITPGTKGMTRGMTEKHATFEDAKKHLSVLADKAMKLGWKRKATYRGFVAKPDAFSELPTAPKSKK